MHLYWCCSAAADLHCAINAPSTCTRDESKQSVITAIQQEKIMIGMPAEAVNLSWGPPDEINNTVTASSTQEQWVYGDHGPYVYINNGKVESWQNTK